MKRKRNISLEDYINEKAEKRAKALGMNFSAYLTYLINKDYGEIAITETIKNDKVSNAIGNIIGDL